MRIVCLQHMDVESPARIAEWAAERGHSFVTHRLYAGDPAPALEDFDLLLMMGGSMGVYEAEAHPWIPVEVSLTREAIAAGRHVLGVCLGAQIIAEALGARVYRHEQTEIGWFPVRAAGEPPDPLVAGILEDEAGESMPVLHWHQDTFDLPEGARLLAASEATPRQAFRVGERVLALQFHLELGREHLQAFFDHFDGDLGSGRWIQTRETMLAATAAFERTRGPLYTLLDRFVAGAPGAAGRVQ